MKLTFRQIEPFVKNPDKAARVILIYGPDNGLMRERARQIGLSVVTDLTDPFNVAVLSADQLIADPARLQDEASALSMMGGDRLIRIENASDKITPLLKTYLANPSRQSLVILEAGELTSRSPLRILCEKSPHAAALPCYVEDERDLTRLIREMLQAENRTIENDAAAALAAAIQGNHQKARSEIEKLITYKGTDFSPIKLADIEASNSGGNAKTLDDLIYGTAGQRPAQALEAYTILCAEGVSFVPMLRSLQTHFRKLHVTKLRIENGESADTAFKKIHPPIFFKQENDFKRQLQNWTIPTLDKILMRLNDVEAQCKRTHAPVESLCAQAVLGIAMLKR